MRVLHKQSHLYGEQTTDNIVITLSADIINMTHRMKKHYNMLNAIHQCTLDERKQLLRAAKPELIHAICDCIVNMVYDKAPISNYNKCQLRKKVSVLKKL